MNPAPPVTRAVPATERQRRCSARRRPHSKFTRKGYPYAYPLGLPGRCPIDKMRSEELRHVGLGTTEVGMARNRRLMAVAAASLLALFPLAGTAYAATPQTIYRDLADNGHLDGRYTRAEIERAFDLPPAVGTDELPREPIRVPQASEAAPASQATGKTDRRIPLFRSRRCLAGGRGRSAAPHRSRTAATAL